jgi:hypothetical protein
MIVTKNICSQHLVIKENATIGFKYMLHGYKRYFRACVN